MALTLTLTTELEAVNQILGAIGESPVNTLDVPGLVDASIAQQVLHDTSKEVQSYGWWFNSETDYPLSPDVNGNLLVPANVLHIATTAEYSQYSLTQRGTKMYDRIGHTDVFTDTIKFDIRFFLNFETLPEQARKYITARAARTFQKNRLGSDSIDSRLKDEELSARMALLDAEADAEDFNMLTGSVSTLEILLR